MMSIQQAILRNCLVGNVGDHGVTIAENAGNVVFHWSNGKSTRMRRAENGTDQLVELPDGKDLRISGSIFSL